MEIILALQVDNGGWQQRRTVFVRADNVICGGVAPLGAMPGGLVREREEIKVGDQI